jgi:hypothetical protein
MLISFTISLHFTVQLHLFICISYITLTWCMCVLLLSLQLFSIITQCVFTEQKPTRIVPLEKVLSYNKSPARSPANAIKNATDLHLLARKIISLCLKFRTPALYSHLSGSTFSCLKTENSQDINMTMIQLSIHSIIYSCSCDLQQAPHGPWDIEQVKLCIKLMWYICH